MERPITRFVTTTYYKNFTLLDQGEDVALKDFDRGRGVRHFLRRERSLLRSIPSFDLFLGIRTKPLKYSSVGS